MSHICHDLHPSEPSSPPSWELDEPPRQRSSWSRNNRSYTCQNGSNYKSNTHNSLNSFSSTSNTNLRSNSSHLNYQWKCIGDENVMNLVLTSFCQDLDFCNYRLWYRGNRINAYGKSKVDNRRKHHRAEMVSHIFNPTDSLSILDFQLSFRRSCKNL